MSFNMTVFGKRVQKLRKSRKMSQAQLAMVLNISVQYLSNIETSQRMPAIELLVSIAEYFNVSLDFLILGIANRSDHQKQLEEELAQGLKHLAMVDRLLKEVK